MKAFFTGVFLLVCFGAFSQVDTSKIYAVAEQMPIIPNCAALDTTEIVKRKCSQEVLLKFLYKNIRYPDSARLLGIEGTVVVSFVVEKDSTISNINLMKDIGGGCGIEAMRVVNGINQLGLKFVPGTMQNIPVRVQMNVPIKFKLKEIPPYILEGIDTVYTEFTKPLSFKGGMEALTAYIDQELDYPSEGNDSCSIGIIESKALIEPNGVVRILEMNDYNNLGFDCQFEAINTITSTIGKWEIAEYKGRKVPTDYLLRLYFKPDAPKCQSVVSSFEKAEQLAIEGSNLFNQGEKETGIAKLDEALALFPGNAEFLYARGQAHLDMNNYEKACVDLTQVKAILLVTWVDNLLPIICNAKSEEAEKN